MLFTRVAAGVMAPAAPLPLSLGAVRDLPGCWWSVG